MLPPGVEIYSQGLNLWSAVQFQLPLGISVFFLLYQCSYFDQSTVYFLPMSYGHH